MTEKRSEYRVVSRPAHGDFIAQWRGPGILGWVFGWTCAPDESGDWHESELKQSFPDYLSATDWCKRHANASHKYSLRCAQPKKVWLLGRLP